MSTEIGLAAALAPLITRFGREYPMLATPQGANDRCDIASDLFAERCRKAGLGAEVIHGVEMGEVPEFPGHRVVLNGHVAVLIADSDRSVVVDWTARQFDPAAAFPHVCTPDAWRETWQDPTTLHEDRRSTS